jgi:hypothetical protein
MQQPCLQSEIAAFLRSGRGRLQNRRQPLGFSARDPSAVLQCPDLFDSRSKSLRQRHFSFARHPGRHRKRILRPFRRPHGNAVLPGRRGDPRQPLGRIAHRPVHRADRFSSRIGDRNFNISGDLCGGGFREQSALNPHCMHARFASGEIHHRRLRQQRRRSEDHQSEDRPSLRTLFSITTGVSPPP